MVVFGEAYAQSKAECYQRKFFDSRGTYMAIINKPLSRHCMGLTAISRA